MALFFKLTGPNVPKWFRDEIEPRKESAKAKQHGGKRIIQSKDVIHNGKCREHEKRETTKTSSHEKSVLETHRSFGSWSQE